MFVGPESCSSSEFEYSWPTQEGEPPQLLHHFFFACRIGDPHSHRRITTYRTILSYFVFRAGRQRTFFFSLTPSDSLSSAF